MFTIRYGNPSEREFQLSQFSMKEDEIKDFLDIVYETVYNPPKFKDKYDVGDSFIIPYIKVLDNIDCDSKEITYKNVKAIISSACTSNITIQYYTLSFDGHTLVVTNDYIDKLERTLW